MTKLFQALMINFTTSVGWVQLSYDSRRLFGLLKKTIAFARKLTIGLLQLVLHVVQNRKKRTGRRQEKEISILD